MFFTTINYAYTIFTYTLYSVYFIILMLHTVLPFGIDVGLFGVAAYYMTRLKKPNPRNVINIFGPQPGTKESEQNPDKVVHCIAHRGAGLDAPENSMAAFKYCVEQDCKFVELDVRTSKDGKLVLLHDQGLERLASSNITDVQIMDWDNIKDIDIGAKHPNRQKFKEVNLCLLGDALDFLMQKNVNVIIDVKGDDQQVIDGILDIYKRRPGLYEKAAVTCFNPITLYQIRRKDHEIVGAISYRPYAFSALDYDAEHGPSNPRFGENLPVHACLRTLDALHAAAWRWSARWCGVSAVLLHKDIISPSEIQYWRDLGIRCAGWCVNRPVEKLYWRSVLKAPYLANTLLGEPEMDQREKAAPSEHAGSIVDDLLESKCADVQN